MAALVVTAEQMLVATGLVATVGSLARGVRTLRWLLALIGAAMLVWGIWRHHAGPAIAGGALATVSLLRVGLLVLVTRKVARFTAEEDSFRERCFPRLSRAAFRQLLDQGLWINGRAGETLFIEGEPVANLLYLSEGAVRITGGGHAIAESEAGHFFGELDVLARTPAIATVTLTRNGRFWVVGADALSRLLDENPQLRPAIELAMASELREKLRERSRQIVRTVTAG